MSRHLRTLASPALLVVLLGAMVTACGSGASSDSSTSPSSAPSTTSTSSASGLQPLRIALDWTPNVNFLGIYVAIKNGYFTQEGIKPVVIPYSGTAGETLIESEKTDLAFTYPPNIPAYRASGLKYRAVAGLTQQNTIALAVLQSSPYTSPAQLSGKLYGGFGVPSDPPIIKSIFRATGVKDPSYREVVLNGSAYQALVANRVAYTTMFGGIDDVTAELQGAKLRLFPIRDYLGAAASFPDDSLAASDKEISTDPTLLQHGLAALSQGYIYAVQHPAEAEADLIQYNPTALAHSHNVVVATGNATAPTFLDAAGQWGSLSDASFAGITQIMATGGLFNGKAPPPASDDYTNGLLPQG
ncbi:MAG TPA: ABC transporter substrate-binding protein [Acidimicrobiales bacterium]|nr:ABC transporter substrate-binding protein [Acidimicrobiales bacterium]